MPFAGLQADGIQLHHGAAQGDPNMGRRAGAGEGHMMKQLSAILALWCVIVEPVLAMAQTMSYADAIDQLAVACRADLQKYCKGVELGGGRLKDCLDAHQTVVSARCQQTRAQVYASIGRRIAAQRNIGDVCSADINRLCGVAPVDNNLVVCLLGVAPSAVSPACNQAFTDTGWRTERAQR
jgi:hypothetical protein